jgi:maltose O-acetyltransferase
MSDGDPQPIDLTDGKTMRARMEAGDYYTADGEDLQSSQRSARLLARRYADEYDVDPEAAKATLHELFGVVGEWVEVRPPVYVDYGVYITIGAGTFINYGLQAADVARITIGEAVQIGPNVMLLTPTHPVDPELRRSGIEAGASITLEDNVWLGGGVTVCPGVTIGKNSVIGAGSVVVKDIPPNVVAVGNPARVVREI